MPFLLHTIWLGDSFLPYYEVITIIYWDSRSPPQSPYPDVVPLRLFQILRFFPYPLAHKATCLLPNKMSITDWFFFYVEPCFSLWYFIFPLLLLYYSNTGRDVGKSCWWEVSVSDGHLCWPHWVEVRTPCHMSFAFCHWAWPSLFSQLFSTPTQARLKEYFSLAILYDQYFTGYTKTLWTQMYVFEISVFYL